MTGPHVDQAVAALAGKAQRLRASAASQPRDAARKRELADGLDRLASLAAHGPSEVRRLLDSTVGEGISADARKHASNEIYSLAVQRESQGAERNAPASVRAGWERGGYDLGLPIHRATLQEAVELLVLAEVIHPEPFWTWTRAGLLERLGEYALAAEVYESPGGAYGRHAPECVSRCRAKAAGTYDPLAENARHLQAQIARCRANGVDPAPIIEVQSHLGELLAQAAQRQQPAPNVSPAKEPPVGNPKLERAAQAAQAFAELLADGNFEEAQQRLSKHLRGTTADALRRDYERMTMADEFPQEEPVEIVVMMAQDDMPNLQPGDFGWVYVAITGTEFNEAVTVVVTDDGGSVKIREIEWGRP
ncbi:MAG: hypothetical protein LW860_14985 [Xanthomonadaceae bacterium]|jgi:hypothetical protein|nr:hypothetical protein [Xanthomonadaceae bacterium]